VWVSIDKRSTMPMLRQIYESFRTDILSGKLQAGTKLPSTRELSAELRVSRNVILEAYELLLAEGFIVGRSGSGTFVAEGARMPDYTAVHACDESLASATAESDRTEASAISFRTGMPALDSFPRKKWSGLLRNACLEAQDTALGYGDPAGDAGLRRVLAAYLSRTRGVIAQSEHIIVTNGAVQALQLVTKLLLTSGDEVIVEEPSNDDLKSILSSTGAVVRPVPVDDGGLMTSHLPQGGSPRSVYVTPSHQFPLGGILPIQRRIELIAYAEARDCYILEDDYDSEFRFDGAPIHSLQSLDPERVIYIGTFSKVMFPALRIGYVVVPPALVDACIRLKRLSDYQTPSLEQLALAQFIEKGHLHAHVFRMKKVYLKRRQALLNSLEAHFPGLFRVCGKPAGLHLSIEFAFPLPGDAVERLCEEGVYAAVLAENRLALGYGHLRESEICEGVGRLSKALLGRFRDSAV